MNTTIIGTFEETFGENRGNDASFFLDDDNTGVKQEQQKKDLSSQDVLNELDLLGCEALDKDSIEKNLDKLIDWFRDNGNSKMEQSFLDALPEKLDVLFLNIKDQIDELDYNATSKLKIGLKRIESVDFLKGYWQGFDKNHNVTGALENHFRELVSKLKDQSKKIKKQKNYEKKKKLYEADKQDRLSEINKTNNALAEDDLAVKGEMSTEPKYEDEQFGK